MVLAIVVLTSENMYQLAIVDSRNGLAHVGSVTNPMLTQCDFLTNSYILHDFLTNLYVQNFSERVTHLKMVAYISCD